MSASVKALEALDSHWAVGAISTEDKKRADTLVHQRLAMQARGEQIEFSFAADTQDDSLLERVALAFELAAIEGLDELSRPAGENHDLRSQAVAAAFRAFEIRRLLSIPGEPNAHLYFVLQLSAIAYCGDRWSDLWQWYQEKEDVIRMPSGEKVQWDRRLLHRLFDCWIRLFRKQNWSDLNEIHKIIAELRNDQAKYEADCLDNGSPALDQAIALRLAALYNWAKATETLASYILQGEPNEPFSALDKHFEVGI